MLTLVSGPFHPHLEAAFRDRIRALKADPLAKIAVVTPSTRLKERLQIVLAESGMAVLNVHFHTFASLAHQTVTAASPATKPILTDPVFFDTLIKFIMKDERPFRGVADLAFPDGFPMAVKATLEDLIEAGVPEDSSDVIQAIKEDFLGKNVDIGTLLELLRLYRIYLKKIERLPILSRSELTRMATARAPKSKFLAGFKEIIYYGFYDLTGLQADFFQTVVKHHPARFFFPYVAGHPAYVFAARFRDTFLQPVLSEEITVPPRDKNAELDGPSPDLFEKPLFPFQLSPNVSFKLWNVSGMRDEAWVVSGEILRLHEQEGVPFQEMAVVGRVQDRLSDSMPAVFRERNIPFRLTLVRPISEFPQVEAALSLLELTDRDVRTPADLDFMSFPDFKKPEDGKSFERPSGWPESGSWSGFVARALDLLEASFAPMNEESSVVWELMKQDLKSLDKFDLIRSSVSRQDFLETLRDHWGRIQLEDKEETPAGVSLLYAEAARCLPFRVVFVIGAEEKGFPRIVREDPFLRDDARFALSSTLGYKITQKLTALEEEKLLFHLFTSAAQERLYITYQRSDQDGGIVGPSTFLRALVEARQANLEEITESVPRPYLAKIRTFDPSYLGRHEIVTGLLAWNQRESAYSFVKRIGIDGRWLSHGLNVQDALQSYSSPGAFDGLVGPQITTRIFPNNGRISPSALETYGLCPFKFFASRVLELEPLETMQTGEVFSADVKGKLVHDFFEVFYRTLTESGKKAPPAVLPEELFDRIFDEAISSVPAETVKLHPVLWEALRSNMKLELKRFIKEDLVRCHEDGFMPAFFEHELAEPLDPPLERYKWGGRIDRMDVSANGARVVDYKTGYIPGKKVSTLALRGVKAQPPIYILLAEKFLKKHGRPSDQVSFVYFSIGDEDPLKELSAEEWSAHKDGILETLKTQLDAIHHGDYPIMPEDSYCSWCDVAQICRRSHSLSAFRSEGGPAEALWAIREKNPVRIRKAK